MTFEPIIKVVLLGGNPKGHDLPFHPSTLSGKRLRSMLSELNFSHVELADMTENKNDIPTEFELANLLKKYGDYKVVFLGRFVEKELRAIFPKGMYLPHPASRRKGDLERLRNGLKSIIETRRRTET